MENLYSANFGTLVTPSNLAVCRINFASILIIGQQVSLISMLHDKAECLWTPGPTLPNGQKD
jgi:hypothetical protein